MRDKNMVFGILGKLGPNGHDLAVLVHTEGNPSNVEWDDFMTRIEKANLSKLRTLVVTAGGGPSSVQRKRVVDFLHGERSPVAVVSSNPMVRGVVTALSWFNATMASFPESSLSQALDFLQIDRGEHARVRAEVRVLRKQLGVAEGRDLIEHHP
jgi:hypothetical protein